MYRALGIFYCAGFENYEMPLLGNKTPNSRLRGKLSGRDLPARFAPLTFNTRPQSNRGGAFSLTLSGSNYKNKFQAVSVRPQASVRSAV